VRLIAVLVVCCCAGVVMAQSHPPTPTPAKPGQKPQQERPAVSREAYGDRGAPEQPSTPTNLPVSPKAQLKASEAGNDQGSKAAADWWITSFTGVLAVVALLQWWAMRRQATYMQDALKETRDSSREALEQTRRSNAATEKSNEIAEKAMIYSKRSWLVATDDSRPPHFALDGNFSKYTLQISVTNTGGVPALVQRQAIQIVFTKRGVPPPKPQLGENSEAIVTSGEVVVPNDSKPIPLAELQLPLLMQTQFDELRGAIMELFIFYIVEYTDCFERPWRTVACWRCGGESLEWEPAPQYATLRSVTRSFRRPQPPAAANERVEADGHARTAQRLECHPEHFGPRARGLSPSRRPRAWPGSS
jgi:hypothetical protein